MQTTAQSELPAHTIMQQREPALRCSYADRLASGTVSLSLICSPRPTAFAGEQRGYEFYTHRAKLFWSRLPR